MFFALFLKECRQLLKSLVYYIYVIIFVLFITSQMGDGDFVDDMVKPEPGQDYYGMAVSTDKQVIMENTLASLVLGVYQNNFATYPMGFIKHVVLGEEELEQAKDILVFCTGESYETLETRMQEHFAMDQSTPEKAMQAQASYKVEVKEGLTYEQFCEKMEEMCGLLGRGSSYEKAKFENGTYVPATYEQAMEDYMELCNTDRVTGAYMRLFCDYAGIVLAILPIFIGVSGAIRDKRTKAEQVIFAKPVSGMTLLISRYLAAVCMVFLPIVVIAFLVQQPYLYMAQTMGISGDALAFLKYTVVWLLPEIMIVLALSMLLTYFSGNIVAVFVQTFWGIGSLFGAVTLTGDFGLRLVARWNNLGKSMEFLSQRKELFINRGYYAFLAVLCLFLAVFVYERKRKRGGCAVWKNT